MLKKTHNLIKNRIKKNNSHLLKLSALGLLSGLTAAIIIVAFRYLIESTQIAILPGNDPENYEALPPLALFFYPLIGGILIGLIFHFLPPAARLTGLIHTIDAIKNHKGHLPLINTFSQFVGAAISIIAGHSVGREGPSVHLGASGGGLVAKKFGVSEQVKRTLLACGVAAAIAASFNTPIAGVIFSLEVIMLEYTAVSTIPIIIASLTATIISHAVFGDSITLESPHLEAASNPELMGMIINGIAIGLIAAAFIRLITSITQKSKTYPIFWRLTLAGAITGALALIAPEIMSIGYDTLVATFNNEVALYALLIILALKILATTIGLGLGLPGGLIGPTLVIGALTGGVIGVILHNIFPEMANDPGMYAMIGMGAMMGATLQAPLAALIAIFELTMNPHIILPGLLAIVAASLTCSELLKQPSIIFTLTRAKEINYDEDLLTEKLKIMPIESLITPIDKNEMSQPHLLNHYKPVNILQDTTIAEAIAAFRTTHNNHLNVYLREDNDTGESHNNSKNNNDTNKTMLGIIKRQDLSNFIQQFEDS